MKEDLKVVLPIFGLFITGGLAKGMAKKCKRDEDDLFEGFFKGISKFSYAVGYITLGLSTICCATCKCDK